MSSPSDPLPAPPPAAVSAALHHPRTHELLAARRRFLTVAWSAFLGAAALLFGGAALFPRVWGLRLADGLSLGLLLGLLYMALVFALTVSYARRSRGWDIVVDELRTVAQVTR